MTVGLAAVDVTYRTRNNLDKADAINDYAVKSFGKLEEAKSFIRGLAEDLSKAPCKTYTGVVETSPRVASLTLNTGDSAVKSSYILMYCPNRTAKLYDGMTSGAAISEWAIATEALKPAF